MWKRAIAATIAGLLTAAASSSAATGTGTPGSLARIVQ